MCSPRHAQYTSTFVYSLILLILIFKISPVECFPTQAAPICERVVLEDDRSAISNLQLTFEDMRGIEQEKEEEISMLDGDLDPRNQ